LLSATGGALAPVNLRYCQSQSEGLSSIEPDDSSNELDCGKGVSGGFVMCGFGRHDTFFPNRIVAADIVTEQFE